jgi:ubiquitin-protein ligase E3 A
MLYCSLISQEGGSEIPVTRSNVKEYVHLYCKYVLQDSIASMARAFLKGFGMVVLTRSPALRLFRAEELELLVVGSQELDFDALEKNTTYEGGYSESSTTVRMFWDVAKALSPAEKGLLLMFATGSSKAPVGGLGAAKFRFKIQRSGPDSPQLPTAHTCFNTLLIPDYKDKDKMRARLLLAIQNSEGFGLE